MSWQKGDWIGVFQKYPTGWWKGLNYRTNESGLFNPMSKIVLISLPEEAEGVLRLSFFSFSFYPCLQKLMDISVWQAVVDYAGTQKDYITFRAGTKVCFSFMNEIFN